MLKLALVGSASLLFLLYGYGCTKIKTLNNAHASDEISEPPSQERSEYLERLRSETIQLALENISLGQYDEAIDIAEKAVAELEDRDSEDYPVLAARLYFQLGAVSQKIRAKVWMKEVCAYERATEIIGLESNMADTMYSALASSYDTMGGHEEAEENYVKAIVLADSIQTTDGSVYDGVLTTRKDLLIFYREHRIWNKAAELVAELHEILEKGYPPTDELIGKGLSEDPEMEEWMIEQVQEEIAELKKLLEEVQAEIRGADSRQDEGVTH